jgi:hypothetical protein
MFKVYRKLVETPIPDDWDKEAINNLSSFSNIIKSILLQAKKLGAGSSRIAFEVNQPGFENTVIKVAKNIKGLAQNSLEAEIASKSYYDHIVPKLIDEDTYSSTFEKTSKPLWIQTEKAEKASPKKIKDYLGIDMHYSLEHYFRNNSQHQTRISFAVDEKDKTKLDENERIQDMLSLMYDYDLSAGDLARVANLGFIDKELVIIDTGASKDVINTYYIKKRW